MYICGIHILSKTSDSYTIIVYNLKSILYNAEISKSDAYEMAARKQEAIKHIKCSSLDIPRRMRLLHTSERSGSIYRIILTKALYIGFNVQNNNYRLVYVSGSIFRIICLRCDR